MKNILLFLLLCLPLCSFASDMGTYRDLIASIQSLKNSPQEFSCKKEIVTLSERMIFASDQTIAETIMFMLAASDNNKKPIFCPPKGFSLSGSTIEHIILEEYFKALLPKEKKLTIPVAAFAIMGLKRKYPC